MPTSRALSVPQLILAIMVLTALGPIAFAANQVPEEQDVPDLTGLSMEELLDLDVTSITRTSTDLKNVPSAIYVLNSDAIRRSGATSIPEALRMVPGMHVARIDGNKWAVSTRGFNSQFGTKLLVLMDGRTLYTPMFSVVWWDQEDVLMEDIERIEVIRGSGGSLWGANAVNGVVNIITKKAKNSQGGLVSGQGGSMRQGGGLRYGADLGKQAYLKVYGRYSEYDGSGKIGAVAAGNAGDESRLGKIGFRFDKDIGITDKLTLQGDAFSGFSGGAEQGQPKVSAIRTPVVAPPYSRAIATDADLSGHYLLGRWEHRPGNASSTLLRLFWNRNERKANALHSGYQIDSVDVDFQHNIRLNGQHSLVWGSGARLNHNQTENSLDLNWTPSQRLDQIYSLFAQDEITLIPGQWKLTLGGKLEHNPVTEFEWQPSARLSWTPVKKHAFWASVSRSVRTPNWIEQDFGYNTAVLPPVGGGAASPGNPVTLLSLVGNKQMRSETLLGYELGWRGELSEKLASDISLYYYDYDDLCSFAPKSLDLSHLASGYAVQIANFANYGSATVYGGEATVDWQVADTWKLRASYAYAGQQFKLAGDAPAGAFILFKDSFPVHQAMLWSMHKITPQLNLDLNWRFVDSITVEPQSVAAYQELDARLAWDVGHGLELALVGRNLLDKQHAEFGNFIYSVPTTVQREVYATVRWNF